MENVTTTTAGLSGLDAMDSCNGSSGAIQYAHSTRPPAQGGNEGKRDRIDPLPKRTDKGRGRIQGGDKHPLQGSPRVPRRNLQAGYAAQQTTKTMTRFFINYNNLPEALILLWLFLILATTRPNTGGIPAPMTNDSEAYITPSDVRAAIDSGRKELNALKEKRASRPVNKLVSPRFGEVE